MANENENGVGDFRERERRELLNRESFGRDYAPEIIMLKTIQEVEKLITRIEMGY